ncbi:unnamed protein product [Alternaria alternata]
MTDLNRLRPCGRLETYSTARHHLGFYKSVGFTAEYVTSEIPQLSLEDRVYFALRHVIAEHPILSAIAVNEDQSYPNVYFAHLPEIDLRTCVEICERKKPFPNDGETDEELDEMLAQQHSRGFKEGLRSKPYWRLLVFKSPTDVTRFTATWMWHHALADGASAFLFHESFLGGLNSPETESNVEPIVKSSTMALPPPLEELHPMTVSWPYFIQAILGALLPSAFAKRPPKLWTGNPVQQDAEPLPQPRYHTLVLSKPTTDKLVQLSRAEKTSMTATLQCLIAASLFAHLPAQDYEKLKIEGPIAMKRFLDVEEKQMTLAMTQYGYHHERLASQNLQGLAKSSVLDQFSWDIARAVKSAISAEVAKAGTDNSIALLKYVSSMPQFFLDKLGKPRYPSAELSNVGVWKNKQKPGNWAIGRMVFSQSPNVITSPLAVSVVTGGDGNATLNYCWIQDAVEDEFIWKVIEGVKGAIEGLVAGHDA